VRPRPARPARHLFAAGLAIGLTLALSAPSLAQNSPNEAKANSLARYLPKGEVNFYLEFDGLDAHADAWKKTAASKILNETPTGAMLETVAVQLLDRLPAPAGEAGKRGAGLMAVAKHMARSGFVLAEFPDEHRPGQSTGLIVLRDAFKDKEIRSIVARMLQGMNAPGTKPQAVVRAGHKVIGGVTQRGTGFSWWVEEVGKADIVLVSPVPEAADGVLETLDGKHPNAVDLPARADLFQVENGFTPIGGVYASPAWVRKSGMLVQLGLGDFKRLDFRFGFQGDALMSVVRLATPAPRKGIPALFDGPSFEKGALPPIPETVSGFTATSLDLKATYEKLVALAKTVNPDAGAQAAKVAEGLKAKSKVDLEADLLKHLGPKVAWYVLPAKAASKPANAPSNLYSSMLAGAGIDQLPRAAIVMDVDDPTAFNKVLDEVMVAVNREFKAMGRPPGEAAPNRGGRGRGQGPPSPEFRVTTTNGRMYALNVPQELAAQFPASFRPALLVEGKHLTVAISPEVARQAAGSKGSWTPSNGLALAYPMVPAKLKYLSVGDPSEGLPALLAGLPSKVQATFNTALMLKALANPPAPGAAATPGAAPAPDPNPNQNSGRRGLVGAGPIGGSNPNATTGTPNVPGGPGGPGSPTTPGEPGAPGGPAQLVLQVDAAKLPSADAIRALLFPSLSWVESDGDEIRLVSRVAFPEVEDPSKLGAILGIAIPMVRGGGLPPGMTPPPGMAPPPGGIPGAGRPGNSGGGNTPARPD